MTLSLMLDFEHDIIELQEKIQALRHHPGDGKSSPQSEIEKLEKKVLTLLDERYKKLTPWQKVQVARHPERPKTRDYIVNLIQDFTPLAGDRCFGEDCAILGGMGFFQNLPVMIMGSEKGTDTDSRMQHNFGMAHPEGYRKISRLMSLADQFSMPIIFLVDTPGAYAGVEAEKRGQAHAIAQCIEMSFSIEVPILSIIIGEGGSGGAVAMASANYIGMLEHSVYSVISPEACSSILFQNLDHKEEAAVMQKMTAQDLLSLQVIDEIISEPLGGAQRNVSATLKHVEKALLSKLEHYLQIYHEKGSCRSDREEKFLSMGRQFLKN